MLFLMDGLGVRPTLQRMADRIAASGYCVLLPNLFYRHGRSPLFDTAEILRGENREKLMEMVHSVTPQRLLRDAGSFLEFLGADRAVTRGRPIGLCGYCLGGSLVVRIAAAHPERFGAGATFHGSRLATDAPDSPHLLLGQIRAELYFGHADTDPYMPAADIARLEEAARAAGIRYRSELYAGAQHGFTMPDLPVHDPIAAARHWERLLDLFARTLDASNGN